MIGGDGMTETRPFVPWDLMRDFMIAVFEKEGVPHEDAEVCTEVLLESDRRGIDSTGLNLFTSIVLTQVS